MFRDRTDAGRRLAEEVAARSLHDPVVLALPRGGVPVGFEVARRLGAPLDVFVARKVGAPSQPELGVGAVAEGGPVVVDDTTLRLLGVHQADFDARAEVERTELQRRVRRYRGERPLVDVGGRDVVLVDDGLATGVTAEAALLALRARSPRPRRLVLAVPVAAADTATRLASVADDVVVVAAPSPFQAVGRWYGVFDQTTDGEVVELLAAPVETEVGVPQAGGVEVPADLAVPARPTGVVVFAHGSGSGRRSPRNRLVADRLHRSGFATLLLDLLVPADGDRRFDIALLADRVEGAVAFARSRTGARIGCFGASTGAAAALAAAARRPGDVAAVVSRGGRPDLAGPDLAAVRAPTLLIVGGADTDVLGRNREAATHLRVEHRVEIVPGASHLFEEPGALEQVAALAAGWFAAHLGAPAARPGRG